MTREVEYIETEEYACCPFCDETLNRIAYRKEKLSFGFMSGFAWVIMLLCPACKKVLGTQNWG